MKLLIVNDEVIAAKGTMTGINWKKYGIDLVDVAFEANAAREKLTKESFDIILCDIEMPGESGIELVRWIRQQQMEVEVIFLTCHADFEFAQEAIRLQCRNYILVPAAYEVIAENVYKIVQEIEQKRNDKKNQMYGKLWLSEKEQEQKQQITGNSPEKTVKLAEEYIMSHLNDPELSVSRLAEKIYLNADYLNRVFKRMKGQSVGRYILNKRMELASALLEEGKLGAMKVSELAGYNTYSAFVTAFKNFYKVSPSHYVAEHQQKVISQNEK